VDALTELYHDHGNTIALQYGGSNLVNTTQTYRKMNPWSNQSRDMLEAIKRYYSNSFVGKLCQHTLDDVWLFTLHYRMVWYVT
jgi:hypothetical protein